MNKLIIKNIGPISHVEMDVNKLNVIIGPQSSGKSTIAKILSFCLWLEKDIIAHQGTEHVDEAFVKRELLEYHKIGNYLKEQSYIHYDNELLEFTFHANGKYQLSLKKEIDQMSIGKVSYIPAERHLAAILHLASFELENDYVRDFVFNWLAIHNKYQRQNMLHIQSLNVDYFYDEAQKQDVVMLSDGKELTISEVSSGMQSLIPLYAYFAYCTDWVFQHDEATSYDKYSVLQRALMKSIMPEFNKEQVDKALELPELRNRITELLRHLQQEGVPSASDPVIVPVAQLADRIGRPHYANVIIEEPELNIFPQTQVQLVYELLASFNVRRDRLLLTTHSPYLLYAVNNCMLGYMVKDSIDPDEVQTFPSHDAWIDPSDVSLWQITSEGTLENIKNSPYGLVGRHYFNDVMNETLDEYHSLLEYVEL